MYILLSVCLSIYLLNLSIYPKEMLLLIPPPKSSQRANIMLFLEAEKGKKKKKEWHEGLRMVYMSMSMSIVTCHSTVDCEQQKG